uniref:DUF7780 domain-containing protein n=1 Tax=Nelumbo nucifera TaxID=4432 RepID=A0A822XTH0_NELNU|nr:TPA_asm: hypothetical protein HUJ06_023578 [Nelumbo nucifera]
MKAGVWDSLATLQGMKTLFRRGTRAMSDLVVAHITEDVTNDKLHLFIRSIHQSGLIVRFDVTLIFSSSSLASPLGISSIYSSIIREENDAFLKLICHYRDKAHNRGRGGSDVSEDGGELGKGVAVTLWLVDTAMETDDSGNATVLGKGSGDGSIPWVGVGDFEGDDFAASHKLVLLRVSQSWDREQWWLFRRVSIVGPGAVAANTIVGGKSRWNFCSKVEKEKVHQT